MPEATEQFSSIESWVHEFLRVPPRPEPPEGSRDSIQVFHAGRNYYTWCVLVWAASHLGVLAALVGLHLAGTKILLRAPEWVTLLWRGMEALLGLIFLASAAFTFVSQRLNYSLRWYMVTDRSLRIRTGILSMQEITMTFSNIQEIRVTAGPIQNYLKLADVEVRSAGGGSGKDDDGGHCGRFEGVSNANEIRDLMVERLRQYRDSGLGESHADSGPAENSALNAAREVLAEARALREHLTPHHLG